MTATAGRTAAATPKATAADFAQLGLEPGAHIWVPHAAEVWRGAIVVGFEEAGPNGGGGILVDAPRSGMTPERIVVPLRPKLPTAPPTWLRRNPELVRAAGALAAQDLGLLALLHEAELLHALQARFEGGVVYTYTGPMLLAVNPFRNLPDLYSYKQLRAFVDLAPGDAAPSPHVYGAARNAYQGVWRAGSSQTVLVSGESGAGKTETTKFVMRFLALAGAGGTEDSMSTVERRVLQAIPLLEALGNAKTLRNNNSSRFGKYTELQFGRPPERPPAEAEAEGEEPRQRGPRLAGAKTHCYLLEKVRVVGPQEGERSFHLFYQLLAAAARRRSGAPGAEEAPEVQGGAAGEGGALEEFLREAGGHRAADFAYLASSSCEELQGRDEAADFDETVAAMRAFEMSDGDVAEFLAAVLAVLHLGNVSFRAPANNSEGSEVVDDQDGRESPLASASRLLGVDPQDLEATLCRRVMKVKDERSHQTITQIRTVAQAADGRDALARHLYGAVFAFAISCINSVLGVGQDSVPGAKPEDRRRLYGAQADGVLPFVGVLDIFGFEFFECNSFEQLCINFTNELLQQYFNEVIFEHEAALYTREGVQWDPQDFPDNKAIVVLLAGDGKGSLLSGVLPMLDEECNVTGGTSETWCRKLVNRYGSSRNFQPVKHRQGHFIVHHFAGPVEYDSEAFLAKNKDTLSADVLECMKSSKRRFVQQRFLEHDRSFGTKTAVSSGRVSVMRAKSYSVSSEFRQQLKTLMEGIRSTNPHFIRCIKPNPQNVPSVFHRRSVVEQLRYQGVLEAIQVSRAGYPVRHRHREAVLDHRRLAPKALQRRLELEVGRGGFAEAAAMLFGALKEALPGLTAAGLQVGATQVFLKREAAEVLAAAKHRLREAAALRIQTARRRVLCMRSFAEAVRAVVRLQCGARASAARSRCRRLRRERAALRLQRTERGRAARRWRRVRLRALTVLQGFAHARFQRAHFLRLARVVLRLQCWFRRVVSRVRRRRVARSAVLIQRQWRGCSGRRRAAAIRLQHIALRAALRTLVHRWRRRQLERVRSKARALARKSLKSGSPRSRGNAPAHWPPPGNGELALQQTPPASPSSRLERREGAYSQLLSACEVGSLSTAEVSAATAVLERTNDALAEEAMALQRLVTSLQMRLNAQEVPMGLAGLLRCCYTRDVSQ